MSTLELALVLVMLAGLVGVLIPIVPGLILVIGAGLVWAGQRGGAVAWAIAVIMALIGIAGMVAASVLPARRATAGGAPVWVVVAGGIGVVIGFFAVPVAGALLGFPAGVLVAELYRQKRLNLAWRATLEAMKGVALGIVIQLAAGVTMIGLWLAGVFVA